MTCATACSVVVLLLVAASHAAPAPERARAMEPALPVAASGSERILATRAAMGPVMERFRAGDKAAAVDGFMRMRPSSARHPLKGR